MTPELILLKALLNKDLYDEYRHEIPIDKDNKELTLLFRHLDGMHNDYPRDLSFNDYYVTCLQVHPDPARKVLLDNLEKYEVGEDVVKSLLIQLKEKNLAHKIALTAIGITEGKGDLSNVQTLLESYQQPEETTDEDDGLFVSDDLVILYETHVKQVGLRWRLRTLNRMLGSLRKGNFGFIFARPETGKTTFLASEVTFMANQLTEEQGPIIWFNNEEDGKQVQLRIIQAAIGVELFTLHLDLDKHKQLYRELTHNKIKVVDNAATSKQDVERICKKYKPALIIFDQLDKVKGFDGDQRDDLRLGIIYQWARELAKIYCPVIGVTQADGSGEGTKWLTMANVANAKTAKQAEADWILGIGKTNQDGFEYIRHLHASKNKLPGDEDSEPALRHGKIDVIIEPGIARYKDYE